jgi:hypothetical protein
MLDHISLMCASVKLVHQSQIFLLLLKLKPLTDVEYVEFKVVQDLHTLKSLGCNPSSDYTKAYVGELACAKIDSTKLRCFHELNTATICLTANLVDVVFKYIINKDQDTTATALNLLHLTLAAMSRDTLEVTHSTLNEAFMNVRTNILNAKECVDHQEFDDILKDHDLSQDYKQQLALALQIAYSNAES